MIEIIDGTPIEVRETGAGPTVIFVHGLGCDQSDWRAQVNAFASRFTCVSFDLPGHGRSSSSVSGDIGALARMLVQIIEHRGREGCVLVGHSLGCRLILEGLGSSAATRRLVRAIAFLEQSLVTGGEAATVQAVIEALTLRVDAAGIHAFLRPAFAAMFVAGSDPKLQASVLARLDDLDATFARELLLSATKWEARAAQQLMSLQVPVLLVQSTYLDSQFQWHRLEPNLTTPWIDLVKRCVADCTVEILTESGHFSPLEAADRVNDRLLQFIDQALVLRAEHHVAE